MHHTGLDVSSQQPEEVLSTYALWKRWMDKHTIIYGHRYYCLPEALSRCNVRDDVQIFFPRPRFTLRKGVMCVVTISTATALSDSWFPPHASVYVVDWDVYQMYNAGKGRRNELLLPTTGECGT